MTILERATRLIEKGFGVLPILCNGTKKSAVLWKELHSRRMTVAEAAECFHESVGIGIIGGDVSGDLEILDHDIVEFYNRWRAIVEEKAPGLLDRLPHVITPTDGMHIYLKHEGRAAANSKLAYRKSDDGSLEIAIETRGEGGYVVSVGSPASCHKKGELYRYAPDSVAIENTPTITKEERDLLFEVARSLDETPKCPEPEKREREWKASASASESNGTRPGDDFEARTPWGEILEPHGWRFDHEHGGLDHWTRPGKDKGTSATTGMRSRCGKDLLHVFSSNAFPLQADKSLGKFAAYAILNHSGDFKQSARELGRKGFGDKPSFEVLEEAAPAEDSPGFAVDPGPFPSELLEVPGLIGKIVEFNLRGAHKPNPVMALVGALPLMATLIGRKIKDSYGARANLYVVMLANTGAGKERARAVNSKILGTLHQSVPSSTASAAGLLNHLQEKPSTLYQLDEFSRMIKTLRNPHGSPHLFKIIEKLLELYTTAGTYFGDTYADVTREVVIPNPNLCLLATSTPEDLIESLVRNDLQGGLLPRMLVFDAIAGGRNFEAADEDPPEDLCSEVERWDNYKSSTGREGGNLSSIPILSLVEYSAEAKQLRNECLERWDRLACGTATCSPLWTRAGEKAGKLALIHAASEHGPELLEVGADAYAWGAAVVEWTTRRLAWLVGHQLGRNTQENMSGRLFGAIREAGLAGITKSSIIQKTRWLKKQDRDNLLIDLVEGGSVFEWKVRKKTKICTHFCANTGQRAPDS